MRAKSVCVVLMHLAAGLAFTGTLVAQDARSQTFKLGDISLRLSNIAVLAGQPTAGGGLPEKPIPLPSRDLLPPGSLVWITFNYETDFQKSEAPEGAQFLAVGVAIPPGKNWGYVPATINPPSGKAAVRLQIMSAPSQITELDEQIKLTVYTRRNNGQNASATGETPIAVQCRIDGQITLSLTQFREIQATMRKVAELEQRLRALEKQR